MTHKSRGTRAEASPLGGRRSECSSCPFYSILMESLTLCPYPPNKAPNPVFSAQCEKRDLISAIAFIQLPTSPCGSRLWKLLSLSAGIRGQKARRTLAKPSSRQRKDSDVCGLERLGRHLMKVQLVTRARGLTLGGWRGLQNQEIL